MYGPDLKLAAKEGGRACKTVNQRERDWKGKKLGWEAPWKERERGRKEIEGKNGGMESLAKRRWGNLKQKAGKGVEMKERWMGRIMGGEKEMTRN